MLQKLIGFFATLDLAYAVCLFIWPYCNAHYVLYYALCPEIFCCNKRPCPAKKNVTKKRDIYKNIKMSKNIGDIHTRSLVYYQILNLLPHKFILL